jgi:Putative auto-transporter adhesin, head GIN domain
MLNQGILKSALFLTVFCSLTLASCYFEPFGERGEGDIVTENRTAKNFHALEIDVPGKIIVRTGPEYKVVVECEESIIAYLETQVESNGRLHIWFSRNVFDVDNLLITVTAPNFDKFEIDGSADLICNDPIDGDDLTLEVSGSGTMQLGDVLFDDIEADVSGSGDIALEGKALRLNFEVSGSGDLDALDCPVKETDVRVSGSGTVRVDVSDHLKARISGSGDVFYRGNPTLDVNVSGSGKVRKL